MRCTHRPPHVALLNRSLGMPMFSELDRLAALDDEAFLRGAYRALFGRDIDDVGLRDWSASLHAGIDRFAVLFGLIQSSEFSSRILQSAVTEPAVPVAAPNPAMPIPTPAATMMPSILAARPEKYRRSGEFLVFDVSGREDYDYLEQMILQHGYYERPGDWAYAVGEDQHVCADLIATLQPRMVLELGCGVGGLLRTLADRGIECAGLDISEFSKNRAIASVADKITIGDLLSADLGTLHPDLIVGFDVFEHLNPNKIDAYFARCSELLPRGGLLLVNSPTYGQDDVFGQILHYWLEEWKTRKDERNLFRALPCDDLGYPRHGHLVWAEPAWWDATMLRHGFVRQREREQKLHAAFDGRMSYSVPRRMYFLMMKR
jgi:SAM-dependent methyltransferase